MSATVPSGQSIRFGVFELEVRAGELRKRGLRVPIQGLPIQLLTILLENRGQVVTREELRTRLWPADTFVDFDHSLHNAIARLREALGEDANNPRFIETLPRRGYRFIGAVESVAALAGQTGTPVPPVLQAGGRRLSPDTIGAPATGAVAPEAEVVAAEAAKPRPRYGLLAFIGLAALSVAILGLNIDGVRERLFGNPVAPRIQSIAVLPLENLSKDPEQEYFADGMTDALIANLAQISALRVISRTSMMRYKGTKKSLPEIARELNVDAVVEGTVQRSGDRVRIIAQLLYAPTDRHLWAQSYERDVRDVLGLQEELALAISQEIRVKLKPQEQARLAGHSADPEAYEAFLKGQYYFVRLTPEALNQAISYYQEAIAKDPRYAAAYAGLAFAYANLGGRLLPPHEVWPKARTAALRALDLDPDSAQARQLLALMKWHYEYDWSGAESDYRRALELSPGDPVVHGSHAHYLAARGRFAESQREINRALQLDPLSVIGRCAEGRLLYYARQYDQAIKSARAGLEMDPNYVGPCLWLGLTYEAKGMLVQAVAELQRVIKASPNETLPLAALARAYGLMGRKEEAREVIQQLSELAKKRYVSAYDIAVAYTGLGDKDQIFSWLEKDYAARGGLLVYLNVEPVFDLIRSDPRFQDLIRRIGLSS